MRSESLQDYYDEYKKKAPKDALHREPAIIEWKYWRLIHNNFPYTKIAHTHMLVVLKRDCSMYSISAEELTELWVTILPWADKIYDTSIMNLSAMRSVANTPHIHLINYLPEYK